MRAHRALILLVDSKHECYQHSCVLEDPVGLIQRPLSLVRTHGVRGRTWTASCPCTSVGCPAALSCIRLPTGMNATQLCSHGGSTRQRALASMTAVVHASWRGPMPARSRWLVGRVQGGAGGKSSRVRRNRGGEGECWCECDTPMTTAGRGARILGDFLFFRRVCIIYYLAMQHMDK